MRKYQFSLKLHIADDLQKPTEARELQIYTDGNDLWQTIAAGFHELISSLKQTRNYNLPSVVVKEHDWK